MDFHFRNYFSEGEIVTFRKNSKKFENGEIVQILENGVVHIKKLDKKFVLTPYLFAFQTDYFTPVCKINCAHQGRIRKSLLAPCSPWCAQYDKGHSIWEFLSSKWNYLNFRWRY